MNTVTSVENKQIEAVRAIIRKYFLPDCLKPEYNGMSTYELASIMLREADGAVFEAMGEDHDKETKALGWDFKNDCPILKYCGCRKCGDQVSCYGIHDPKKSPHEESMCGACAC